MSDCVSRQAAIDAHCELCPDKYICCPVRNGNICPDYEVFRLLPSAQPHWIPCSERLPEEDNWTGKGVQFSNLVLVTLDNAEDEEKVVDLGYTVDGKWFIQCDARVKFIPDGWELVAWMPLPEPYGGENECS